MKCVTTGPACSAVVPSAVASRKDLVGDADGVQDGGCVGGVGGRVKKARKKDKPTGVLLRVETTPLTTANVISFFTPKYNTPRSRAQRAANPRPSAI
jgi:hypothetical protein